MNLPTFSRGIELVSAQLNKLADAVRRSTITSVIGGTLSVTPGGTTLTIDAQTRGGGSAAVVDCPFQLSDATEGETIKIQVAQNTVNVNTGARWPEGMGPGNPDYKITITETSYFYVKLVYVPNDVIVKPDSDAITIADFTNIQANSVDEEYILIGIVEVDAGKVKKITNQCALVTYNPCNLDWA